MIKHWFNQKYTTDDYNLYFECAPYLPGGQPTYQIYDYNFTVVNFDELTGGCGELPTIAEQRYDNWFLRLNQNEGVNNVAVLDWAVIIEKIMHCNAKTESLTNKQFYGLYSDTENSPIK